MRFVVTDACSVISAGCQSLLPSPTCILQSNVIYFLPVFLRRHVFITPHQNMTFVVVILCFQSEYQISLWPLTFSANKLPLLGCVMPLLFHSTLLLHFK